MGNHQLPQNYYAIALSQHLILNSCIDIKSSIETYCGVYLDLLYLLTHIIVDIVCSFVCVLPHIYNIVKDCKDLDISLKKLIEFETLEGDNQYMCSTCDRKVDAKKGVKVRKLPPVLIMSLK